MGIHNCVNNSPCPLFKDLVFSYIMLFFFHRHHVIFCSFWSWQSSRDIKNIFHIVSVMPVSLTWLLPFSSLYFWLFCLFISDFPIFLFTLGCFYATIMIFLRLSGSRSWKLHVGSKWARMGSCCHFCASLWCRRSTTVGQVICTSRLKLTIR